MSKHIEYGPGGFDPQRPDKNIVEERDIAADALFAQCDECPTKVPAPITAKDHAVAKASGAAGAVYLVAEAARGLLF